MKKSYYYLAIALVTAVAATASADQAPYRKAPQQRYAQDDQQPLPLPPEGEGDPNQPGPMPGPCPGPGCVDNGMGRYPGVNVQGNGNTVIIQIGADGQAYRAVIPAAACYNHYTCQAAIGQIPQWYPVVTPQWGCGYAACNVPGYYNYGYGNIPLYQHYAFSGTNYAIYSPYGRGYAPRPYGFYPQFRPTLRHPARRYR